MASTEVDTDGLRQLAKRIEDAAPESPKRGSAFGAKQAGHAGLASAIATFEGKGVDAVSKLHDDATKMSAALRAVAKLYDAADSSAGQAVGKVIEDLG